MIAEAFFTSTGVVALGEMGDKTQLLALLLAARYRKPLPIIAGILVATLANHAGASALGAWLTAWIDPTWMRWVLGASFIAVALWMLVPDKADDDVAGRQPAGRVWCHHGGLLPGRDGRQDADRHRDAGGALPVAVLGHHGHDAGHDDRQRAGRAAGRQGGGWQGAGAGCTASRPWCLLHWAWRCGWAGQL
jgi:hypothetical protein